MLTMAILALGINSLVVYRLHKNRGTAAFEPTIRARIIGAVLLAIPCIFFASVEYTLAPANYLPGVGLTIVLTLAIILFNQSRRPDAEDRSRYGYLFSFPRGLSFSIIEFTTWLTYLLPYEFLFRSLLLVYGIQRYGSARAFLFNSILYAAAHWSKGKREVACSFLLGFILCLVTYLTGNFWCAWIIHLALAWSNSYYRIISSHKTQTTLTL